MTFEEYGRIRPYSFQNCHRVLFENSAFTLYYFRRATIEQAQAAQRLSSPAAGSPKCSEARAKRRAVGGRVQRLVVPVLEIIARRLLPAASGAQT